jgi:hypothetical protein
MGHIYFDWDRHYTMVEKWKKLFWEVYHSLGDKEFRLNIPLHVKVRLAPCMYGEYKIDTLLATKGLAGEHIKFNLIHHTSGNKRVIDVYPQFELKSNGEIVNETIIFEMLLKYFKEEGFFKKEKNIIETEIVYV